MSKRICAHRACRKIPRRDSCRRVVAHADRRKRRSNETAASNKQSPCFLTNHFHRVEPYPQKPEK
ncbi:hypothetical protein C7S13_8631 [Burkholderia cepacia]|nr:hypothetical protein [Burkholderia cepacia]